jgi:hypothetical protein
MPSIEAVVGVTMGVIAAVLVQTFVFTGHSGKEVLLWASLTAVILGVTAHWGRTLKEAVERKSAENNDI